MGIHHIDEVWVIAMYLIWIYSHQRTYNVIKMRLVTKISSRHSAPTVNLMKVCYMPRVPPLEDNVIPKLVDIRRCC